MVTVLEAPAVRRSPESCGLVRQTRRTNLNLAALFTAYPAFEAG